MRFWKTQRINLGKGYGRAEVLLDLRDITFPVATGLGDGPRSCMNSSQARRLAALLIDVADEVDAQRTADADYSDLREE